jgi:hypothetical protein
MIHQLNIKTLEKRYNVKATYKELPNTTQYRIIKDDKELTFSMDEPISVDHWSLKSNLNELLGVSDE